MDIEHAKEQARIAEIKQNLGPWRNDPILTHTEELPAAKALKKVDKRLRDLKPRFEASAQRINDLFNRLKETKDALLLQRDNLKNERETAAQQWAQAYLRGEDPPSCAMTHLTTRLDVAMALKGLRAAEGLLYQRRDEREECRRKLAMVRRELDRFEEGERITRQARDELLKISPLDDEAVDQIETLKLVVRRFEYQRRSVHPAYLNGLLDETEQGVE